MLLKLLQICDSNFPTGAFSHSFGLETYINEKKVYDKNSLNLWLNAYANQLTFNEALAIKLLFKKSLEDDFLTFINEVSNLLYASSSSSESKSGNLLISRRFLANLNQIFDINLLKIYEKQSITNTAVSFAIFCISEKIDLKQSILSFCFQALSSLVQNAIRAVPLSQKDGQEILSKFDFLQIYEDVQGLEYEDLGASLVGLEIAQMKHESLNFRLFMS